mmetsp:Transcript_28228/g.20415  ORF Transcript_28228/g.20415 Transcript_28228/m.20415 type:complete len:101 (+) Transcript_28228:1707-2009(+)
MGEFATDPYEGKDSLVLWIMFIIATYITAVTFMNLLIAIMGDTFGRVAEIKEQTKLKQQVELMYDHIWLFDHEKVFGDAKYMFKISERSRASAAKDAWAG